VTPFIDLRTVIVFSIFTALLTGSWMLINRSLLKGFSGFGLLASAHFSLAVGCLLLALRGAIPYFFSIVVASILLGLTGVLYFFGIQAFRRVRVRGRLLLMLSLVAVAVDFWYFTYVQPSLKERLLFFDVVAILLFVLCARALLKEAEPELRLPLWTIAAPFLVGAGFALMRFAWFWAEPTPSRLLHGGWFFSVRCILADLIFVGTALGFSSVANRKLALELEREALTDSLTRIFNRRAFEDQAQRLLAQARRRDTSASFLLIDLDHFKRVNDGFGHAAGDEILTLFAQRALTMLRDEDILARYGGEEFVVGLPDAGRAEAVQVAERLVAAIGQNPFVFRQQAISLTVSIGVAAFPADGLVWSRLFDQADAALYQAKLSGRNQVVAAPIVSGRWDRRTTEEDEMTDSTSSPAPF
jgi:diguanylate cyclase (GGDEF)-like protein